MWLRPKLAPCRVIICLSFSEIGELSNHEDKQSAANGDGHTHTVVYELRRCSCQKLRKSNPGMQAR